MSDDNQKHWWLYVLRLKEGKFYVGITSQTPEIRMWEHANHVRSANWTKKYKPIEIIATEDLGTTSKLTAEKRENVVLRQWMKKYGYNNVRGGNLTDVSKYSIVFRRVVDRERWLETLTVTLMLLIIVYLVVMLFIK